MTIGIFSHADVALKTLPCKRPEKGDFIVIPVLDNSSFFDLQEHIEARFWGAGVLRDVLEPLDQVWLAERFCTAATRRYHRLAGAADDQHPFGEAASEKEEP